MKLYSPSDIAELLEVKESTLRKYSLLLEKAGYQFQRNNQNQRWYKDDDVIALKKLVSLKNNGDMSLEECAEAVSLWSKGNDATLPSTDIHSDTSRYDGEITALKEMIVELSGVIEEQQRFIKEQFEQQQAYLNERDKVLMESLRESQEVKKLLIEQKNENEEKKKVRKGIFRWFNNNDK